MDKYKFSNVLETVKYLLKLAPIYLIGFILWRMPYIVLILMIIALQWHEKIPEQLILIGVIAFIAFGITFCLLYTIMCILAGIDNKKTGLYRDRGNILLSNLDTISEYLCLKIFKIEREHLAFILKDYFQSNYKDCMKNVKIANKHVVITLENNVVKVEKINTADKFSANLYHRHKIYNLMYRDTLNVILSGFSYLTTYEAIANLLQRHGIDIHYQPKPEQSEIKTPINSAPENTSNASSLSSERNIDL